MAKYLFDFDIADAKSEDYTQVEEILKANSCGILDKPLGSSYIIGTGLEKNEDVKNMIEKAMAAYDMAFILTRLEDDNHVIGRTEKKTKKEKAIEEVRKEFGRYM